MPLVISTREYSYSYSSIAIRTRVLRQGLRGVGGRVRAARRAALCGVAASLVKQQGYVLAQIVTEINAPDLAAGMWVVRGGLRRVMTVMLSLGPSTATLKMPTTLTKSRPISHARACMS